jgi:hypothetical protein
MKILVLLVTARVRFRWAFDKDTGIATKYVTNFIKPLC